MVSGISGNTEKQAAMRVMEMDNDWYEGKERSESGYISKDDAAKIAAYCQQFGQFPDYTIFPLTRNQRRNIRKKYGISSSVMQPGIPGKEE